MATILIDGKEFKVGPDLKAARVLAAASLRFAAPGDVHRFKLFDEDGKEIHPTEVVGTQTEAVGFAKRRDSWAAAQERREQIATERT